MEMKKKTVKL